MEKVRQYFGKIFLFCLILSIGVFLGSKLERDQEEIEKGSLYDSGKIAVVNLDEGVTYDKQTRNFAKEILEKYSSDFVFAGLADAQIGITDGRYAGYIILPSNFSSNVVSVNTTVQKSLLKYEISGNLTQEATDNAWLNVMKLKENLNDDIGYIYISSILGEFHSGQNNALKVIENDNKDKEVLMAISNLDLISVLDLKEVARLQNDIQALDVNPDIEKNKQIILAIDTAYKGYLGESEGDLTNLKSVSESGTTYINNIDEIAKSIETLTKEDGTKNYSTTKTEEVLTTFNNSLTASKDNLITTVNQIANIKETLKGIVGVENFVIDNENYTNLNDVINKFETDYSIDVATITLMKDEIAVALKSDLEKIKGDINQQITPELIAGIDGNESNVDKVFEKLNITINEIVGVDKHGVTEAISDDLAELTDNQTTTKTTLLSIIEGYKLMYTDFKNSLIAYDPIKNINQKEIESYIKSYEQTNQELKRNIEDKNRDYLSFVDDSYTNANEIIRSMQEDVMKYQKESDQKITTGLENAKVVRVETSNNNQELLNSFIEKLPYTRVGTVENNVVYDFITTPSEVEGNKAATTIDQNNINYLAILIGITAISLAIWISGIIAAKLKKRNNDEEDLGEMI